VGATIETERCGKAKRSKFYKTFFVENYVSGAVFTNGANKLVFSMTSLSSNETL
jgi:hypothetical protein